MKKAGPSAAPFPIDEKEHTFRGIFKMMRAVLGLRVNLWEDTTFMLIDLPHHAQDRS